MSRNSQGKGHSRQRSGRSTGLGEKLPSGVELQGGRSARWCPAGAGELNRLPAVRPERVGVEQGRLF